MNHDHGSVTHSMVCPVEGCAHTIAIHAHSDEDAVRMIMEDGKAHFQSTHPDVPGMSSEEMETATKQAMKRH